jgi:hypothetical protein
MIYPKITEEQDQMRNLIDAGEYIAHIDNATEKKTKNGKYDMIELELEVHDMSGRPRKLRDWIVFMDEMSWKLRHAAKSAGLIEKYDNDTLIDKDFIGTRVVIKVGIKDGDKGKMNNVIDYLPSDNVANAPKKSEGLGSEFFDDALPF